MTDYTKLCTPEVLDWIERNLDGDPSALRLKWRGKYPWIDFAIMQVECRKKARKKLPDELSNSRFIFPTLLSAEQSTSDTLAKFHATLIGADDRVIDMTCGLGIDTFHLSERAREVTAIDINPDVAGAVAYNAAILGKDNVKAVNADCIELLYSSTEFFDTAFIDPARRGEANMRIYKLSDCLPDVTSHLDMIARHANRLVVKMSPLMDISQTLRELPQTTDIYVVGTSTECKELVACVDFRATEPEPIVHTWSPNEKFSFTQHEEADAEVTYGEPIAGGYLYEPSATAMKAAPWRLLSSRFHIDKLHPNSHLYTSTELRDGFPGSCRSIVEVLDYTSHNIKDVTRRYKKINVAARNFGITADALRSKLKVKDGGDMRLIGTTLFDGRKIMVIVK